MWRFKQFIPKELTGLEGRMLDIGNVKVHVRNVMAEGGFSCVYLANDAMHPSTNYALKQMICNDEESLDLAKKEISVLKILKGHPNVITLISSAIFDMGRTKEVFLLMEFCEKSLVNVLENRGAGYFEEKQVLLIFRDVCNAVFAMHCQSPPIAHRDLKAENVLLGADAAWKLCDFGSTSTNHKYVIRKHTTPAYRAPEMWDLFRREIISEKVDIWALGCLLYRICYLKSAFDGESKLQILNGNYRIPELPKYTSSLTELIKDLLQSSPDDRPDITQVWFRVNLQLPEDLQKQMPDGLLSTGTPENHLGTANMQKEDDNKAPLGAFWSTQHAREPQFSEEKSTRFDDEPRPKQAPQTLQDKTKPGPPSPSEDFEIRFDKDGGYEEITRSQPSSKMVFQNEAFNTFVAEFDTTKISPGSNSGSRMMPREELEAEVERLKEQLKQANLEKADITSRYEKLSAICRSQRQEIQELKQSLAVAATMTPSQPSSDGSQEQTSPGSFQSPSPQREKIEGSIRELSSSMLKSSASPTPDSKPWQPFAEQPRPPQQPRSVRTINGHHRSSKVSGFTAADTLGPQISRASGPRGGGGSRGSAEPKASGNQPSGWAGF
ncbi:unnamed protein product [Spirodela intermedia]|uniref:non-specific serine/threonine protein kinase n=1 Tax=Spirodela intermedia TaxID=51605 RepID=A0A7I8JKS3_SPIIN|nr:unnamed protein product [Spirodela intermedia]CAA6670193.1 unnamed protein product [Spirodela intermedia]